MIAEEGGAPLAATVEYTPSREHCDGWIFPGKVPSQIPVPPGEPTADWAHGLGGIDNGDTRLRVVVQGRNDHDVVLRNLRAIEQRRIKLSAGTPVMLSWGCGGDIPIREYRTTLGGDNPDLELVAPQRDGSVKVVKRPFGYKVSGTDPEIFAIEVSTPYPSGPDGYACLISWRLVLDWSHKGKQGTHKSGRRWPGVAQSSVACSR
jgi:hypothetical protein